MEKCQKHKIPRPYLKVTAAALSGEVFGVCHLGPRLLEPRQAVQTHSHLPSGSQSMKIGVRMMINKYKVFLTWLAEDLCLLPLKQSSQRPQIQGADS